MEHPIVKCKGDNDPVDVVEIGSKALATGSVSKVKINIIWSTVLRRSFTAYPLFPGATY